MTAHHIDVSYMNICRTSDYLSSVLDEYSCSIIGRRTVFRQVSDQRRRLTTRFFSIYLLVQVASQFLNDALQILNGWNFVA